MLSSLSFVVAAAVVVAFVAVAVAVDVVIVVAVVVVVAAVVAVVATKTIFHDQNEDSLFLPSYSCFSECSRTSKEIEK